MLSFDICTFVRCKCNTAPIQAIPIHDVAGQLMWDHSWQKEQQFNSMINSLHQGFFPTSIRIFNPGLIVISCNDTNNCDVIVGRRIKTCILSVCYVCVHDAAWCAVTKVEVPHCFTTGGDTGTSTYWIACHACLSQYPFMSTFGL
jgi:hypothetical protein